MPPSEADRGRLHITRAVRKSINFGEICELRHYVSVWDAKLTAERMNGEQLGKGEGWGEGGRAERMA